MKKSALSKMKPETKEGLAFESILHHTWRKRIRDRKPIQQKVPDNMHRAEFTGTIRHTIWYYILKLFLLLGWNKRGVRLLGNRVTTRAYVKVYGEDEAPAPKEFRVQDELLALMAPSK